MSAKALGTRSLKPEKKMRERSLLALGKSVESAIRSEGIDLQYSLCVKSREKISREVKLLPQFYHLPTIYHILGDDVYRKSKTES
jgi:hypothetical protein